MLADSPIAPKMKSIGIGTPCLELSPLMSNSKPNVTLVRPIANATSMAPRFSQRDPTVGCLTVVSAVITR